MDRSMTEHTNGTVRESRKRVLVGIAIATGVLCVVAAASAALALPASPAPIVLVVAGGAAFALAVLLWLGRADWLAEDDQVLWAGSNDVEDEPR